MTEISRKQNILYSLWVVLCGVTAMPSVFMLLFMMKYAGMAISVFVIFALPMPVSYLIAAFTSRYRGAWSRFWGVLAGYTGLSTLSLYMVRNETAAGIVLIMNTVYCVGCYVLALMKRRSIVVQSVYAHSPEYREQKQQNKHEKMRQKQAQQQNKYEKVQQRLEAEQKKAIQDMKHSMNTSMSGKKMPVKEPAKSEAAQVQTHTETAARADAADRIKETVKTDEMKLDINACAVDDLLQLPGMSLAMAGKAIEERQLHGDYQSVDDFIMRNDIKPHIAIRFMEQIVVGAAAARAEDAPARRRKLDL